SQQVIVSWQIGDRPIQRQLMQRNEAGTYDVAIDVRPPMGVDSARMHLWVEAGDDAIGPLSVGLVPRLQVSGMAAEIQPPAYCGLEDFQVNLRQQAASVPV